MGEDEVVANLLKDFEEALNDDKIYIAFELLKQLEMKAVDNKQIVQELEKRKVMIMTCQMLYTKIKVMVEDMTRDKNWSLVSQKRGISVYHRETPDNSIMNKATVEFPIDDKLDMPREFVKLLSLVVEVDLMPLYFPNKLLRTNEVLHESSAYSKHFHMKFHPGPLVPLSKRDGVAVGRGFDLSESGEVVITYDTLPEGQDETGFLVPEPEAKYVRLNANGAFYFGLNGRSIVFSVINKVDVKVKVIPPSVLNFISRHLWADYAANFRKAWKFYEGSEWEKRVSEKQKFYDEIYMRIAASLKLDMEALAVHESKGQSDE